MDKEYNLKDLIHCYFSVDYNEKENVFYKIINYIGFDDKIFKRNSFDSKKYDIIVNSLYRINYENDLVLCRPMNNLINILSNVALDEVTMNECINSYCDLMKTLLKRKEQKDMLSLM